MKLIRTLLLAGIASGLCSTALYAADYYVQAVKPGPVAGTPLAAISLQASTKNTATSTSAAATPMTAAAVTAAPVAGTSYKSVAALMQSGAVQGGDRVFLMDGYHGPITLRDMQFASPVIISGMPRATAHVDSINVFNSTNLVFTDLKVWPTLLNSETGALVRTYAGSSDIIFTNLDVRSAADAGNYLQWDLATWRANKHGGFLVNGKNISVVGNRMTGLYNALFASAKNARLENNIVDGFAGDGMRANGDFSTVRGNRVQNCHHIDANHDDGFQSFSYTKKGAGTSTVYNLTIENNKIFEWNASVANTVPCKLQGIGLFDGMFDNLIIRNNVVSVSAWHGISVAGTVNAQIVENTVVNPAGLKGNAPWIRVTPHKNGTPSTDVLVASNTTNWLMVNANPTRNIAVVNNVVVGRP